MTYDISSIGVSAAANGAMRTKRDTGGGHPLKAWRMIRQAVLFVSDVASEARRLRRSLHQKYRVPEE